MFHYTYSDDFSRLVLQQQFKIVFLNMRVYRPIVSIKTKSKAVSLTRSYLASHLLLCPVEAGKHLKGNGGVCGRK